MPGSTHVFKCDTCYESTTRNLRLGDRINATLPCDRASKTVKGEPCPGTMARITSTKLA